MGESASAGCQAGALVGVPAGMAEPTKVSGEYQIQCRDAVGALVWEESFSNLVTLEGKHLLLNVVLAGAGGSGGNWFMGIISSEGFVSSPVTEDTASSHAGWTEFVGYSQLTRPRVTFNQASNNMAGSNAAVVFTINDPKTIKGCFLTSDSAKGGTSGFLYSAGLFAEDKPMGHGYSLSLTYTAKMY